jgi:hypothetical protein
MVQIHGVLVDSVHFMFLEVDRQPFSILEEAVTLVSISGVHIMWDTRYVVWYKTDSVQQYFRLVQFMFILYPLLCPSAMLWLESLS